MIAQSFDFQVLPLGHALAPAYRSGRNWLSDHLPSASAAWQKRNHPRRFRTHPVRLREPQAARVQACKRAQEHVVAKRQDLEVEGLLRTTTPRQPVTPLQLKWFLARWMRMLREQDD